MHHTTFLRASSHLRHLIHPNRSLQCTTPAPKSQERNARFGGTASHSEPNPFTPNSITGEEK